MGGIINGKEREKRERTDILLFLARTLQVEEEWLIGVSDMESDTAISSNKNRDLLDKNDTSNTYKQPLQKLSAGTLVIKRKEQCVNLRNHPN